MLQNGKKCIKNHIEKFLKFYKKNKALREVQIAKKEVYMTRKSKELTRNRKGLRYPAQTHTSDGSGSP